MIYIGYHTFLVSFSLQTLAVVVILSDASQCRGRTISITTWVLAMANAWTAVVVALTPLNTMITKSILVISIECIITFGVFWALTLIVHAFKVVSAPVTTWQCILLFTVHCPKTKGCSVIVILCHYSRQSDGSDGSDEGLHIYVLELLCGCVWLM